MRFSLIVTGPAYGTQQSSSALQFAEALMDSEHQLVSVLFHKEGVYNSNQFTRPASDEFDLVRAWYLIGMKYDVKLYVCVSAALRRGVINLTEDKNFGLVKSKLEDIFLYTGIGILTQIILNSDRVIQF